MGHPEPEPRRRVGRLQNGVVAVLGLGLSVLWGWMAVLSLAGQGMGIEALIAGFASLIFLGMAVGAVRDCWRGPAANESSPRTAPPSSGVISQAFPPLLTENVAD